MATVGQRYKDPKSGMEYQFSGGDSWIPVSNTYGGKGGGGGAAVTSFQLGYQDPASTPVTTPPAGTSGGINPVNPPAALSGISPPAVTAPKVITTKGGRGSGKTSTYAQGITPPSATPKPTPAAPSMGGAPSGKQVETGTTAQVGGTTGVNTQAAITANSLPAKTQTFTEGQTRGEGKEIYRNGQWVANTPLPSSVKPVENLIAPQEDANPVSNAQALNRAVGAEFSPFAYTSQDVARESQGLGLGQYTPSADEINQAVDLYGRKASQDYSNADFDLRNRYGGAGLGGGRVLDSARLAQDFSLNKSLGQQNLRNQMQQQGYNQTMGALGMGQGVLNNRQGLTEGRYNSALNAALQQNSLQTGLTQQERARAHQSQENLLSRQHEAATAQSMANQQGRASIASAILPSLVGAAFPGPETAEDAYYKAQTDKILQEAGINPADYGGGDGSPFSIGNILEMFGIGGL